MLNPSSTAAIDALIAQATANPHSGLPRLVVIAASSKEILYTGAGGYAQLPPFEEDAEKMKASLEAAEKIKETSVFDLFSSTKLVTVIAAIQLMEKGVWTLTSDAQQWVPELQKVQILQGWTQEQGGEPILEDNSTTITIEMLINHTAGFSYASESSGKIERWVKYAKLVSASDPKGTRESITGVPLLHKPGTHWQYGMSNDWLCLAIEGATGMRLSEYLQKNIFGPLGITDMKQAVQPHINMAYETSSSGHYRVDHGFEFSTTQDYGGHGLKGSPSSYIKILQALLRGGEPIFKKSETVKSMFLPHISQDEVVLKDLRDGTWEGQSPFTRKMGEGIQGSQWGVGGVLAGVNWPHGRKAGSMTWSGLSNNFWVVDPESDLAFVIYSNLMPYGTERMFATWEKIEPEIYKGLRC